MSKYKWNGQYPVRCRIEDVTGQEVMPGIEGNTPDVSKPHIGKEGTARLRRDHGVKIIMDDGSVLMGEQCWWDAIGPVSGTLDRNDVLKAIADEPEYPGDAPPVLVECIRQVLALEKPERGVLEICRLVVRQTKDCITDSVLKLKGQP